MTKNKFSLAECRHQWENLYQFKSVDGKSLIQQRCKKCHATRYIEPDEENDQNGSKT